MSIYIYYSHSKKQRTKTIYYMKVNKYTVILVIIII